MDGFSAELIGRLLIYMVVLVLAISVHEAAHAWMSWKFGDNTAYMLGRVTLNPISHTDPIGTLLIPAAAFLIGSLGGPLATIPLIGWGKPTPVNPRNWTNYSTANVMVSIAGILANLILALIAFTAAKILILNGTFEPAAFISATNNPIAIIIGYMLTLNVSLAIFNLLPFPPLDGSKVLSTFLPASFQPVWELFEQYGFMILLVLMYMGVLRFIMIPVILGLYYLLAL